MELAQQKGVFLGGDDFKSGQTKVKSVLVDFLVSAGIKVCMIIQPILVSVGCALTGQGSHLGCMQYTAILEILQHCSLEKQ